MFSGIRARIQPKSVSLRLTLWYLLTMGASLAGFAVFVYLMYGRTLYSELDSDLDLSAHRLVVRYRPVLLSLDPTGDLEADPRAAEIPFIVREAPGRLLFRSPAFPSLDWAGEGRLGLAARSMEQFITTTDLSGQPVRVVTLEVERPGAETLAIQVSASTALVRRGMAQLAWIMSLAIAVVLAVASWGSTFTARRALAPVDEIVERARHIQAQRLDERLEVRADSSELDRLVQTLNEMLDRIGASFQASRRFTADASHELQTPIAVMRAALELSLRRDQGAPLSAETAVDLLAEIERLSSLIRDLRLLSLADAGQLMARLEPVDVAAVLADSGEVARAIAEPRQIRVEILIQDRPTIAGSALHLGRAFLNVAENAVRYSPSSSSVQLCVGRVGEQAVVGVKDWGSGIGPADLPHIFEPFYRSDPARARDTGGTGLGLAIADQVVRAHGGRIEVESTLGAGSSFTIYLPLAPGA